MEEHKTIVESETPKSFDGQTERTWSNYLKLQK